MVVRSKLVMQRACSILLLVALLPQIALPREATLCLCNAIQCQDCGNCCRSAVFGLHRCGDACSASGHKACCERCAGKTTTASENKPCRGCLVLAPHNHDIPKPQPQDDGFLLLAPVVHDVSLFVLASTFISLGQGIRPTAHAPPDAARALPLLI